MITKKILKPALLVVVGCLLMGASGCAKRHDTFLFTVQDLMTAMGLLECYSMQDYVDVTQKEWLRAPGKERWQIADTKEDQRTLVMPYITKLGLVDEHRAKHKNYDYACVLGATLSSLRFRLAYMQACWNNGVRFKQIVCLVGQRPLDKEKELDVLVADGVAPQDLPATETDMMRYLLDTVTFTGGLEDVPVVIIDTPGTTAPNGTYRRPTTADTVTAWLATHPQEGSILAISNQPFCVYQQVVLKTLLPATFTLETVGAQAAPSTTVAVYLDSLARILYQAHTFGYKTIEPLLS